MNCFESMYYAYKADRREILSKGCLYEGGFIIVGVGFC